MNPNILNTEDIFEKSSLEELAAQEGPCLTLLLPAFRPGGFNTSHGASAKALLKSLEARPLSKEVAQLRDSLHASLEQQGENDGHGGPGVAIFCAPGFQASYRAHDLPEQIVIGSHFYLLPLMVQADIRQGLFALTLSTKHLRLFHYDGEKCEQRALPQGIPDSLEEAGNFNRSESGLSSRKSVGASGSRSAGVHFGTISEPKTGEAYLHDYFESVDRGLQDVLGDRPLLLLGVQEEIAAYRRAAEHKRRLLDGPAGNADFLRLDEIATRAQQAALEEYNRQSIAVLHEFREMPDRHRTTRDIHQVLRAAAEGRVHHLCVREATFANGKLPSGLDRAGLPNEDLLNAAAVETLRASGQVYIVPGNKMSATEPVAAILRY